MAVAFHHGVETIEETKGPNPITTVKSAVVGLVGTAPMGAVNTPIVVRNRKEAAAAIGTDIPGGFTIPQAVDAIFDHDAGTIIIINVLDPAEHTTAVADEVIQFDAKNKIKLDHGAVSSLVIKSTDGNTTYDVNDDYTVDPLTGEVTRVASGAIPAATDVHASYNYADPTQVDASDIIGEVTVGGNRTGLKALEDTYNLFGFLAKLIIAPVYCTQNSVAAEMIVTAEKLRAMAIIDAPIGTTPNGAIEGRGTSGAINFQTSSDRVIPCYPHLEVYDANTDSNRLEPYSQRMAGVICKTDVEFGFWHSPSNQEILGVVGAERSISARINDPNTEANALNAAGIVTLFNSFGTGLRTWGNRSAAYPSTTEIRNFIAVRRTADMIHESLEYAQLKYQDKPTTRALIDQVLLDANAYVRSLVGRGALVDGEVKFREEDNPISQLAAGQTVYYICFVPPIPNERMTFKSVLDTNKLEALFNAG